MKKILFLSFSFFCLSLICLEGCGEIGELGHSPVSQEGSLSSSSSDSGDDDYASEAEILLAMKKQAEDKAVVDLQELSEVANLNSEDSEDDEPTSFKTFNCTKWQ